MIEVQRDLIHEILIRKPKTRNSDEELYIAYLEAVKPGLSKMPACELLRLKGAPKMRSIERERRYWQRKDPKNTKAKPLIKAIRKELEEEYRQKYSKEK